MFCIHHEKPDVKGIFYKQFNESVGKHEERMEKEKQTSQMLNIHTQYL